MKLEDYIPTDKNIYDLNSSYLFTNVKELDTVKTYNIEIGETMENISYKLFDTDKYWFVLALYNDIIDPFNPEAQTRTLRIPSRLAMDSFLSKSKVFVAV